MLPIWFLALLKFIPFFPPIAASTIASKVVGTLYKGSPLLYVEAASPPISQTIPPPSPSPTTPILATIEVDSFNVPHLEIAEVPADIPTYDRDDWSHWITVVRHEEGRFVVIDSKNAPVLQVLSWVQLRCILRGSVVLAART